MNSTGVIRSYMAKTYENEAFMILVGEIIEGQLKEWDESYYVNIMKFQHYIFLVNLGEKDWRVDVTPDDLKELQAQGPYSLDRFIWKSLQEKGLSIRFGYGNYLYKVFGRL